MEYSIDKLNNLISKKEVEYDLAFNKLEKVKEELDELEILNDNLEFIRSIIVEISEKSQEESKNYIENTVTLALSSVFGNEYKFVVNVEEKRGQQEISFFIDKNGLLLEPREDTCGGGILGVASNLGLRSAVYALESEVSPIFLLDEPMRDLYPERKKLAAEMVRKIANELNIQMLIITHEEDLISIANKTHKIERKK